MKLYGYEWIKLAHKKIFWLIWVIVLAYSIGNFANSCYEQDAVHYKEDYRQYIEKCQEMPAEEAQKWVGNQEKEIAVVNMAIILGRENQLPEEMIQEETEIWIKEEGIELDYPALLSKYEEEIKDPQLMQKYASLIFRVHKQLDGMIRYQEYIGNMSERSSRLEGNILFQDKNSFSYRNIQKSVRDYEGLEDVYLNIGEEDGILTYSNEMKNGITDFLMLFFLLLTIFFVIAEERENKLDRLQWVNPKGKFAQLSAKIGVIVTIIGVSALVINTAQILIANASLGMGDVHRNIQSLTEFRDCAVNISVLQYLLYSVLLKCFVMCMTAVFFTLLFTLFSNVKVSAGICGAFLLISYLLYHSILPNSIFNFVKYVNLFSFLDCYRRFSEYQNLNIFGFPFSILSTGLILFAVLIVSMIFLALLAYYKKWEIRLPAIPFLARLHAKSYPCNLFAFESRKLWIAQYGWIFLAVILAFSVRNIQFDEVLYPPLVYSYREYITRLGNDISPENTKMMEEEQQRFDQVNEQSQQLNEQYHKGLITKSELSDQMVELRNFAELKNAYDMANMQYQNLLQYHEKGYDVKIIPFTATDYFFKDVKKFQIAAFVFMILTIFACGSVFASEYQNGMIHLIRVTRHGQGKLFWSKYSAIFLFYTLGFAVSALPFWYNWIKAYRMTSLSAAVQSVAELQSVQEHCSILVFSLLWLVALYLSGLLLLIIISFSSIYLKKMNSTMIFGCGLFVVDFLFGSSEIAPVISSISCSGSLILPNLLGQTGSLWPIWVKLGLYSVSIGLLLALHYRKFCKVSR